MQKGLTETQKHVLEVLRARGADWTAAAAERHWRDGETYYLDSRNAARKGLVRMFEKANREAAETEDDFEALLPDGSRCEWDERLRIVGALRVKKGS